MRKRFALIAALSLASFALMAQTATPGANSPSGAYGTNSNPNGTNPNGTNNGTTGAASSSTPK